MKLQILKKKLIALGCIELPKRNSGSHHKWKNPAKNLGTSIPYHSKEVSNGTVRAIVRQLGINWQDFLDA